MFRKLRERATTFVSWEKWPKKTGAYPKKEIDTEREEDPEVELDKE
jgi:hypothetical protein